MDKTFSADKIFGGQKFLADKTAENSSWCRKFCPRKFCPIRYPLDMLATTEHSILYTMDRGSISSSVNWIKRALYTNKVDAKTHPKNYEKPAKNKFCCECNFNFC